MKKIILLTIICVFFNCKNNTANPSQNSEIVISDNKLNKDTIIILSENRKLHYTDYKEIIKGINLYTKRYLTTNEGEVINQYESYSEVWNKLSPNKKFAFLDDINLGYVYESETDSTLHDFWRCFLVDLDDGKIINTFQSDCSGEWNSNNQWIVNGKVIFDPSLNSVKD